MRKVLRQIKLGYHILKQKILRGRPLTMVNLQITKKCNLRCVYCYADLDTLKNTNDFTTEEWIGIIDELYSMGTRWIRFLGGEPLIRADFEELVDYACYKGIVCEANTNGYFVEKHILAIKKLDSICVSLDGTREINDKCRGKGSYDKAIEAIEMLKQYGINTRIHAVLTKKNIEMVLEHFIELAQRYSVGFNFCQYVLPDSRDSNEWKVTNDDIRSFYIYLKKMKKRHKKVVINSNEAIDIVLDWPDKNKFTVKESDYRHAKMTIPVQCQYGRQCCWIDSDGSLYSCTARWKEGQNIREVGLKKAWEAQKNLDCVLCREAGCVENSLVLDLKLQSLIRIAKYSLGLS